ncbi:MAG: CopD family protein [Gammaproteobacteria bacterium]|nr:CopD family protein [Gammaproteobacteria bacterium]
MLWVKSLHIIFVVSWFAALFYLPRVFVYHAMSNPTNQEQMDTFKVMERKLLIMAHLTGALALLFGFWVLVAYLPAFVSSTWMQLKLLLVLLVIIHHVWCIKIVSDFKHDRNTKSHKWFRVFNEVPVLYLVGIVLLVVVKPFGA